MSGQLAVAEILESPDEWSVGRSGYCEASRVKRINCSEPTRSEYGQHIYIYIYNIYIYIYIYIYIH